MAPLSFWAPIPSSYDAGLFANPPQGYTYVESMTGLPRHLEAGGAVARAAHHPGSSKRVRSAPSGSTPSVTIAKVKTVVPGSRWPPNPF